jgi:hypothetical protein
MNHWIATTAALMLGAAVLAVPAGADTLLVYDIDQGSGSGANASGSFTFDQTTDSITTWDISVVDGSTVTFKKGGLQSASYNPYDGGLAYYAQFALGNGSGTALELFFATPGLGEITAGPVTVPLLRTSSVIVDDVAAAIDNPSVSVVSEPSTFALMLSAFGLVGFTLRRRAVDPATAFSV